VGTGGGNNQNIVAIDGTPKDYHIDLLDTSGVTHLLYIWENQFGTLLTGQITCSCPSSEILGPDFLPSSLITVIVFH
jgi:hypothetical protein